ncbi:13133_t:CDS:2, partial [Funneliformis geosporum]
MSKNPSEISHSHEEQLVMNLKDALDLNSSSKSKPLADTPKPEVTSNKAVESNLESFAKKLGLSFAKNKDDLRKFYDFAGPDFIWPSIMNENDYREIFYFIIDPDWENVGEELATNAIAYHRLIESGIFKDKPKGTYVLIVHGKILKYYDDDISSEDYEEFEKRYPGKYFAPITRKTVLLRKFSANDDIVRKEWQ